MNFKGMICGIFLLASMASAESLLLLPMAGDIDKTGDASTINQLYRSAVEAQFKGNVVPAQSGSQCEDRVCALRAVLDARTDEVVYSTVSRLGSKWVFNSTIMRNDGSDAFNQSLTVLSVEDMAAATHRMADALVNRKTVSEAATMDNIVQKEDNQPEQRRSISASGVALGYLWPLQDSYSHLNGTTVVQPHSQIIRLSWLNTWEVRNDLLLDADLVWGFIDASFGADLNLNYVLSRSDFSPFIGGGLGLHYVFDNYVVDDTRNSGPALNVQGGLLLFRTYDVHVMLRGQYQILFNSDKDQSVSLDAGFTFRKLDFWN